MKAFDFSRFAVMCSLAVTAGFVAASDPSDETRLEGDVSRTTKPKTGQDLGSDEQFVISDDIRSFLMSLPRSAFILLNESITVVEVGLTSDSGDESMSSRDGNQDSGLRAVGVVRLKKPFDGNVIAPPHVATPSDEQKFISLEPRDAVYAGDTILLGQVRNTGNTSSRLRRADGTEFILDPGVILAVGFPELEQICCEVCAECRNMRDEESRACAKCGFCTAPLTRSGSQGRFNCLGIGD